VIDVVFILVAW